MESWKKLSAVSQMSPNPETMEVQMQRSHHLNDEDDTEVDKENVAQGIAWDYLKEKACEQFSCTLLFF